MVRRGRLVVVVLQRQVYVVQDLLSEVLIVQLVPRFINLLRVYCLLLVPVMVRVLLLVLRRPLDVKVALLWVSRRGILISLW